MRKAWRPIKTAPKDGRMVLIYFLVGGGRHTFDLARCKSRGGPGVWRTAGGKLEVWPTHWQPLEPPARPHTGGRDAG